MKWHMHSHQTGTMYKITTSMYKCNMWSTTISCNGAAKVLRLSKTKYKIIQHPQTHDKIGPQGFWKEQTKKISQEKYHKNMWGSHTKYVAAAQLWWAPPKNPQKFMHKQYNYIQEASIKNFIWKKKIFQKIFRKNLSPLHLPPKLSPEEKSLSPRTQTRPLPDSNPPFPAPGPNPSSITPLIPLKIPSPPLPPRGA